MHSVGELSSILNAGISTTSPGAAGSPHLAPPRWVHEVKFDGYRVQLHINAEAIQIFTRRGHHWSERFRKIAGEAWHLNARSAIIDGEVVVPGPGGGSDFSVLQKELRSLKQSDKLVMYAFDLLYLNGVDLRREPLVVRKSKLAPLIARSDILLSEHFEIDAAEMYKRVCGMGLEGLVSKQRDSRYQSDRTDSWRKVTCRQRETLRVVGYAVKNRRFDGLYLGREAAGELLYAGKLDHGFTEDDVADLKKRMKPLIQKAQGYSRKIKKPNAVWVKPDLLVEVEYRAQSAEGKVRHPAFKGFREDL